MKSFLKTLNDRGYNTKLVSDSHMGRTAKGILSELVKNTPGDRPVLEKFMKNYTKYGFAPKDDDFNRCFLALVISVMTDEQKSTYNTMKRGGLMFVDSESRVKMSTNNVVERLRKAVSEAKRGLNHE